MCNENINCSPSAKPSNRLTSPNLASLHTRAGTSKGATMSLKKGEYIDISGNVYGRLKVLKFHSFRNGDSMFECKCDCGKIKVIRGYSIKCGSTASCGCLSVDVATLKSTIHGGSYSSEYKIWQSMKSRCLNPNSTGYKHYGGSGITVCERWRNSFLDFLEDVGKRPEGMTLERKNNNGNYTPKNCKWATWKEQSNNKSTSRLITFRGETKTVTMWSDELNIKRHIIFQRLDILKWSVDDALTIPVTVYRKRMPKFTATKPKEKNEN